MLQNSQENTCVGVSFLIKKTLLKRLQHVFSCEFCEIFKNTLEQEHLRWLLLYMMEA